MYTDSLTKGPTLAVLFLSLCLCSSCGVHKRLPAETVQARDSVTLHIRDSVAVRYDTVTVQLPRESLSALLASSDSSHLETSLAASDAWTDSLGLHHTLTNKAGAIKKEVAVQEHFRSESSVTQSLESRAVTAIEYIERKPTWWERFWISSGKVLWALVAGAAVFGLLKLQIKSIL